MMDLKNKKLFLLDMDGTIYLEDNVFDGTVDFLHYVKEIGARSIFLTNNSSKSVKKLVERLSLLGIEATEEDFVTSVNATILALKDANYKKVYVFGTASFQQQLKDAKINVTDRVEDDIDCLCIGYDTELTFQKIEDACILLNRKIDYIATNPDWVCPTRYGFVPDCGSITSILETATGRKPRFIGKPSPEMVYLSMEKTGCSKEETVIIGDRLYTDIQCGIHAGIDQIFVLSGEGTVADIEAQGIVPTYTMKNIREILQHLKEEI